MDAKIWLLVGLVWLLWVLIDARKKRPSQVKRWELFRERPADLKDAIYHPKEWRKPKRRSPSSRGFLMGAQADDSPAGGGLDLDGSAADAGGSNPFGAVASAPWYGA